jgi:hypothetical protein
MRKLILAVLLVSSFAFAQAPAIAPVVGLDKAFLALGGGFNDVTRKPFAWAAYARQLNTTNADKFPIYTYSGVRAYRFGLGDAQATDFTQGVLFPFYDKNFGKVRVTLAVEGNLGVSTTASNVGYTLGAKAVARVGLARGGRWSVVVFADPNRSSVSGVHATQAGFGVAYGFNGF